MYQINQNQQQQSAIKIQRENENCFRCHKPGHWAKNCLENAANRSPISPTTNTADPGFPSAHCRCGAGLCEIRVSGSRNNPGRKYYRCPGKFENHCGYFMWCDKLRKEEIPELQPESFPVCGCGAGVSTLLVEENEPNARRRYFGCHIKKGEGACNFKQWLDNPPHSALSEDIDIVAEQNNQLGELKLSNEEAMQINALEKTGIPLEEVRGQIEDLELPTVEVRLQMEDGEADEPSDEADEIFGGSTEVHPASAVNNISENHNSVILQTRMDDFAMENVQAYLTTLVATLSDQPSQDLMRKYLMVYLFQELGRIAHPSGHVAISALTSFTRGSFPNFHPTMVHEENLIAAPPCVEGFLPGSDDEPWTTPSSNPSTLLKDGPIEGTIMTGIISQAFEKLACRLQNNLITLLDSMDPHDHVIMIKEAESTFAALDFMQVDYGLFRLRVTEYITQATALARIEQTITHDASSQQLLKRYKNEKSCFDRISCAYDEAEAAFMASSERLRLLRENSSCLKDMLDELETELCCCKVENSAHRDSLLCMTKTMSECKERLRVTSEEAKEALDKSQKRDIERSAVKAAFDQARAQLRM